MGSRQPHQPGCSHVVEGAEEEWCVADAGTDVAEALTVGARVVVVTVMLTSLLHPNQPGVAQEVVVYVVVITGTVVDICVVVVSSRQPHQPGVLQVVVLVRVEELVVVVEVVVESDPLDLKYFQLKQSTHSSSGVHSGTVS